MKNFQILIILLFSSFSVYADNLTGKKIICFEETKDLNNKDQIELMGFEFTSSLEVKEYRATNSDPIEIKFFEYKTSPEIIQILYQSNYVIWDIFRKDLEIRRGKDQLPTGSIMWESKHCNLINISINEFISKKLEKYKQGDLL